MNPNPYMGMQPGQNMNIPPFYPMGPPNYLHFYNYPTPNPNMGYYPYTNVSQNSPVNQQFYTPQAPNPTNTDYMQMKVNMTNLESENIALKEKLKELNTFKLNAEENVSPKSRQGENKNILKEYKLKLEQRNKENVEMKLKIESILAEKEILERNIQDTKSIGYVHKEKLEKTLKDLDSAYKDLTKREEFAKRLNEEIEKMKNYIENIKRENSTLKNLMSKKENENYILTEKLAEKEKEKIV